MTGHYYTLDVSYIITDNIRFTNMSYLVNGANIAPIAYGRCVGLGVGIII